MAFTLLFILTKGNNSVSTRQLKKMCYHGHLFVTIQANLLKFHTHLHHHKGPNSNKGHVSVKIMPLYGLG